MHAAALGDTMGLFMIVLGFILKRIGLFSINDSSVLSKIVLKITLPMAIVSNLRGWN